MQFFSRAGDNVRKEVEKLLRELETGYNGLYTLEALLRQEKYGRNESSLLDIKMDMPVWAMRDDDWRMLPASELVPGDIIMLMEGELTPADVRLIDGEYLECRVFNKNRLSRGVKKSILDSLNVFSLVIEGRMVAVVVRTGMQSGLGKMTEFWGIPNGGINLE